MFQFLKIKFGIKNLFSNFYWILIFTSVTITDIICESS